AIERHHEADERALTGTARADQRGCRSCRGLERDILKYRDPLVVLERHIREVDIAVNGADRGTGKILVILGGHLHDLTDAVEPRERLTDLRADRRDLDDRGGHEAGEEEVGEEVTHRHLSTGDRATADQD